MAAFRFSVSRLPPSLLPSSSPLPRFLPRLLLPRPSPSSPSSASSSSSSSFSMEDGLSTKRLKGEPGDPPALASSLRIGTHNGTFHCDEALGCFMLKLTSRFHGAEVVRTRDNEILESLDAVLDVGGIYDAEKFRFDHHQRGFDGTFGHGFSTKLSSAGLVYKHFGLEIVAKELGVDVSHPDVERVFKAVYKYFVEAIDAVDNGVNQYDTDKPPRYVNTTYLSSRVGKLNPDWMEPNTPEAENKAFLLAMELAGREFLNSLRYYSKSWLPARAIVSNCISKRKELDPSGQIMKLDRYCPWKDHIHELEEELKVEESIKYVLYQDDMSSHWRIQAVAVAFGRFESRKPLPEAWRGLTDNALSEVIGVKDCVFVHSSGFIGANRSFDGALEMGLQALKKA